MCDASDKIVEEPAICHLCGCDVDDAKSREHVPPLCFYPSDFRKSQNPDDLLTLPTHSECNNQYAKDEQYFRQSLGITCIMTDSGSLLWHDIQRTVRHKQSRGLNLKVLNEFEEKLGSIYLPNGLIAKNIDGGRVRRVVWKVIRGLFYHEYRRYLPEDMLCRIEFYSQHEKPPDEILYLIVPEKSQGLHPEHFDYKYSIQQVENASVHTWGLLLWSSMIIFAAFDDPDCSRSKCRKVKSQRQHLIDS